ncbi:glycosyltransferase family 2 protein [Methylobacterium longum]|uniref:Glycosyltransferase family 2 protein n=1 Tax=Methylobacterium longum TaxID=767694 RepID=A0ABT8AV50_9HYPH|nr:glycosyltransferase family 2 protein [Methylobacterium longum]MDN3573834.1 glycosyltransferase family 2 protein [Methylobacterium longum]GJE15105.1 hypothetical protein FOHLNKBM_6183 [Methylobacterium longum]
MVRSEVLTKVPNILIVIPTLNESRYINQCLRSISEQDYEGNIKITVYDGGSTDNTVEIASEFAKLRKNIFVRSNPGRTQSAALNLASQVEQDFEILVRVDAHSDYAVDFVTNCVSDLLAQEADSVVVPMNTVGRTPFQRAVAFAQNSVLGNGGSAHRQRGSSRFVDHGHHAAFRADVFKALGGYALDFSHNEDAEFDCRLTRAGGRIWLSSSAMINYYPRDTVRGLAKQYWNFGYGRAQNMILHKSKPKLRQFAPIFITISSVFSLALALISWWFAVLFLIYAAIYTVWSLVAAVKERDTNLLRMGFAAAIMHVCWAGGFISHLTTCAAKMPLPKNPKSIQFGHSTAQCNDLVI